MPLWAQNIFGDRGLVTSFSMNATKRWVKVRYMKRPAFTCHFDDKPALSVQCFATTCSKTCILLWLVKNLKQTAPTKKIRTPNTMPLEKINLPTPQVSNRQVKNKQTFSKLMYPPNG